MKPRVGLNVIIKSKEQLPPENTLHYSNGGLSQIQLHRCKLEYVKWVGLITEDLKEGDWLVKFSDGCELIYFEEWFEVIPDNTLSSYCLHSQVKQVPCGISPAAEIITVCCSCGKQMVPKPDYSNLHPLLKGFMEY